MEIATERAPAVAGRFYPGDAEGLQRAVDHLVDPGAAIEPVPALALMAPHAGYVYSGALAGQTWARAEVPDRVVLLCPNHTGYGVPRSIWTRGRWALPGGGLEVDAELARAILTRARLEEDRDAHRYEHLVAHVDLLHRDLVAAGHADGLNPIRAAIAWAGATSVAVAVRSRSAMTRSTRSPAGCP